MLSLSIGEFSLVYNMLSFALIGMLGSFEFFVLARKRVDQRYRPALLMSYAIARAKIEADRAA
jgi:hypothetical protein